MYVHRLLTTKTFVNGLHSALEEIEKRAQKLMEKGAAARFIDKGGDSREVVGLVERLREANVHYQVSKKCLVSTSMIHTGGQVS